MVNSIEKNCDYGEEQSESKELETEVVLPARVEIRSRQAESGSDEARDSGYRFHSHPSRTSTRDLALGMFLAFELGLMVGALIMRWLLLAR